MRGGSEARAAAVAALIVLGRGWGLGAAGGRPRSITYTSRCRGPVEGLYSTYIRAGCMDRKGAIVVTCATPAPAARIRRSKTGE